MLMYEETLTVRFQQYTRRELERTQTRLYLKLYQLPYSLCKRCWGVYLTIVLIVEPSKRYGYFKSEDHVRHRGGKETHCINNSEHCTIRSNTGVGMSIERDLLVLMFGYRESNLWVHTAIAHYHDKQQARIRAWHLKLLGLGLNQYVSTNNIKLKYSVYYVALVCKAH